MAQVVNVDSKSPKGNGSDSGKASGEAPKVKTLSVQVPETFHAAVTARVEELEYTVSNVGKALFGMWLDGQIAIPVPIEKVRKDLTAELADLITSDPSRAEAIKKFLADLS